MQIQCPWCNRCGPRVTEMELRDLEQQGLRHTVDPHADGSPCVCRHVTCESRGGAAYHFGRYYDAGLARWVCMGGCEPDLLEEAERLRTEEES